MQQKRFFTIVWKYTGLSTHHSLFAWHGRLFDIENKLLISRSTMKTLATNKSVSREELVSILKNELSHDYKYKLVDVDQERYVLVKKNGAKIFGATDKISIEGVTPTFGRYLFTFAATFDTEVFRGGVAQPWLDFEKSVGHALLNKLQ